MIVSVTRAPCRTRRTSGARGRPFAIERANAFAGATPDCVAPSLPAGCAEVDAGGGSGAAAVGGVGAVAGGASAVRSATGPPISGSCVNRDERLKPKYRPAMATAVTATIRSKRLTALHLPESAPAKVRVQDIDAASIQSTRDVARVRRPCATVQ